jgi:hypothetical protein
MDWKEYRRLLDMKIADASYNMDFAEKKFKEAAAALRAAVAEKEAFEKALDERVEEKPMG